MVHSLITEFKSIVVSSNPMYATVVYGRKPVTKFQTRGDAKNALHYRFHKNRDGKLDLDQIEVYKLRPEIGRYDIVFDSDSDLANLFRAGAFTKEQLVARVFDE